MDLAMQRLTAHQLALDTLRRSILTGRIPNGTRLVQADIAEQLQVSTTPVREALRDLATEGLIRLDAHRGAVVKTLTADEASEIYHLRRLLEPEAMRLAVERITDEELDAAARIQERADAEDDTAAWIELNRQFHRIFVDAARSPRLAGILHTLFDAATMYIAATLLDGSERRVEDNAEHHRLLDAVRRRDPQAAIDVMLAHMDHTRSAIASQAFDDTPDEVAAPGV
jgi:DNA-binding GntR family transcriptional regulator